MIGEALSISQNTVRNYVSKIYEITGKENRSKLILWAMKIDLLKKLERFL
jgi:DNA-binding NarL/FixJ family response regulator